MTMKVMQHNLQIYSPFEFVIKQNDPVKTQK